jgi:hypothetical protein
MKTKTNKLTNFLIRQMKKDVKEAEKKAKKLENKEMWELADPNQDDAIIEMSEEEFDNHDCHHSEDDGCKVCCEWFERLAI